MPVLLVPDASVLVKWAVRSDDEPDHDRALALKAAWLDDACELVVPSLWAYEVGSVLGRKQPETAEPLLEAMLALGLPEETPMSYSARILALMRTHNVTFYDAAYHALAMHVGGTMLTADDAYVRKAGRAGHVRRLADWESGSTR